MHQSDNNLILSVQKRKLNLVFLQENKCQNIHVVLALECLIDAAPSFFNIWLVSWGGHYNLIVMVWVYDLQQSDVSLTSRKMTCRWFVRWMSLLDRNTSDSPLVSDCTACFRKP